MAIDHRILQQIGVRDNAPVLNMFQNALTAAQNRDVQNQQAEQQAALQPFRQQILEQQAQQGQQQLSQARQQQVLKSVNDFALSNRSLIQEAQSTGDFTRLRGALEQRKLNLQQQGLPTETTDDGLAMIDAGQGSQVVASLGDAVNLFNQTSGLQTRVTSSKILEDGTTVQSLSTGGTNVISPSGAILEGEARTKALNKALETKVQQKGDIAQVVSDVKVSEVVSLEDKSKKTKQDIEKQKLNIDETKVKNAENKRELIEAKNLRRKEADNAVIVVSELLKGDTFSAAFGRFNNAPPESLRTQANLDARAQVDQIVGLITLESRNKLKGQGTISDSESKTLEKSSTILTNPLIGDNVARKELRRVQRIFEDASDRNQLKQETKDEAAQPKTFNSTVLGREVSEQDIIDTMNANPGLTRDQLLQQLGIING